MAEPRLLVDQHSLGAGVEFALEDGQARHVGIVLRLGPGDWLRVFNGVDGEWRARVLDKSKRGLVVRVEDLARAPLATPDLDLLFAPVKRYATDLIVEKATELGVRRIRPVITQRTMAETVRVERLRLIAREAAEQTERFDAPEITEPQSLARALDGWESGRVLIYADEESGAQTPQLAAALDPKASKLALLIGPEGGFTSEERAMLRGMGFVAPVSLGPRILRAETAVIAALALIQSHWGDWR